MEIISHSFNLKKKKNPFAHTSRFYILAGEIKPWIFFFNLTDVMTVLEPRDVQAADSNLSYETEVQSHFSICHLQSNSFPAYNS